MEGLPCPCPALPHFWQLGSRFMAEGSRTQAPGKGPPLSIHFLRAQYEGLKRQQRTQAHLLVLPKGGNAPAPAESIVNAVWINKERRSSLSLEEADSKDTSHQVHHRGKLVGSDQRLPPEGDTHLSEANQMIQQATGIPEAAQLPCQVGNTQTKAVESGLKFSTQCPLSIKNPHRSGKPAYYPFPRRKSPRISQAARNLGLYGSP
ncbi:PREDICTED: uncharacterized protein C9orf152 homolog isoform X2 [Cercocebus atys]|uniref:uncharacterized protein C9orf152 homolog isoform X2 n=1 Tax=Cercocebus atys TaxID=9531 RepID=UPI0005F42F7A|nr:PREDICTED: uncharacterized protein C9orf152 homolog isoform X2 [Cercocebus atys]